MVEKNINMAYKIFWQYYPRVRELIEFEDGVSICLEGLVKAAKNYDESKGFTFSTFAYTVIRNHLFAEVRKLKSHKLDTVSLESTINSSEDECTLNYFIADEFNMEQTIENNYTYELLINFINELPPMHKEIMKLYVKGLTQRQIAEYLEISQDTVSKIFNKSINILRVKFSRKEMM